DLRKKQMCLNTKLHIELRAEKNPADIAFFNAPTERLEDVLRNVNAALTARGNYIFDILRTTNNASTFSNIRKESDNESSEEEDFKSPKNTVKRMRKSEKTSEIETTNQLENLMEEDLEEDLHEDNHPKEENDKGVEGNKKTKKTKKAPLR
ncbi:hypothetical protein HHI36_018545, partial [Cryptolaemus montrouzieri]